jgi:uncharacterized membrane protein YwzB
MKEEAAVNDVTTSTVMLAAAGAIFIIAFLGGTYITWQALGVLKWDKIVFDPIGHQTRMLRFILAMIGGFFIASTAAAYLLAGQALRALL